MLGTTDRSQPGVPLHAHLAKLLVMACHPTMLYLVLEQVEKKIVEELQQLGLVGTADKPEPRMPDHADLSRLPYLSCVIKESMRLHTVSTPCQS